MRKISFSCLWLLVSMIFFDASFVFPSNLQEGEFVLTFNREKQTLTLIANKASVSEVLDSIAEKTGVKVKIGKGGEEFVWAEFKDLPVAEVIQKTVRQNYILVYKDGKLKEGGTFSSSKKPAKEIKEFQGVILEDDGSMKMLFVPSESTPEGILEYIQGRHDFLDHLAEDSPKREIQAQLSFNDFLVAGEMEKILARYPEIQIHELNPGWKDCKGGFGVDPEKPFSSELAELNRLENESVIQKLDSARQLLEAEKNGGNTEAIETGRMAVLEQEERKATLEKKGVLVYGAKISGKAEDIKRMRDELDYVRLADPIVGGSLAESLSEKYSVRQISVALSPYDNSVSDQEKQNAAK